MGIVANSYHACEDKKDYANILYTKQHVSNKSYPSSQTVLPVLLKKHVMDPWGGLA